jgi:uncharacterized damage-inducible protein DinB
MAADLFPFLPELRAGTLAAVQNLPDEHWDWKPRGGVHSVRTWLWHIAQVENHQLQTAVLGRPGHEPRRQPPRVERDAVLGFLAESRAATLDYLSRTPALELLEDRRAYDALCRAFQHEAHHRGQIFLHLRMMGLQPPKT